MRKSFDGSHVAVGILTPGTSTYTAEFNNRIRRSDTIISMLRSI